MHRLFLLRHAEAIPTGRNRDHERPLTHAGREAAAHVGGALAVRGESVDLALCSSSARTQETLELALGASGAAPEIRMEPAIYQAERGELMALLRDLPESASSVLLVGHNPAIAEFAALFGGSGDPEALDRLHRFYPPAALAIFDVEAPWRDLRWGGGILRAYLT